MISLEKWLILTPLQELPKNVGGLGKFIVAKGFKKCLKSNKSPNLVTLKMNLLYIGLNDGWAPAWLENLNLVKSG